MGDGMTTIIDDVLKEWGERLYYQPVKGRKAKNIRGGLVPTTKQNNAPKKAIGSSMREKLSRTVGKAPEVMVKISGSGKCMRQIKAHFDYISRKGKLELEDENGDTHLGKDEILDVCNAWAHGKLGIPLDSEKRREAFNLVLSMPPGTDREAVKNAARAFAAERFTNHQYVFVAHDDEKHPHVHLAVKAVDKNYVRLNPRKADLQSWREHFADKLREQGIMANATPRRTRGIVRKAEKQVIGYIQQRGQESMVRVGQKSAVIHEIKTGEPHLNPAQNNIINARNETLKAYGAIARVLSASNRIEDKKLALQIVDFVKMFPPLKTLHQQAVESVRLHQKNRKFIERSKEKAR